MEKQDILNECARLAFRNIADQDYIASRMAHRAKLSQPFLWSALQAFEKYLKAILLFNGRKIKLLRHDLREALEEVRKVDDIPFDIPKAVEEFIGYILSATHLITGGGGQCCVWARSPLEKATR